MKTTLYYFTGTGNTLYLAQRLADELGNTELVSIATVMKGESISTDAENIGIVFPVYCFGTPNIIKAFVQKLQIQESSYLFGCVSYGGLLGGALKIFKKECREAGLNLQAGLSVQMPGNAITTYGAVPEEKQKTILATFEKRIPEVCEVIKARKPRKMETLQPLFRPLLSFLHKPFMKGMPKMAARYFTTDACKLCGECVKVCPVDNISLVNKSVTWSENCEQCMACIQWCAQEAIQLGEKTAARKRYHHSCITKEDIMAQG